jgi:Family of unknown function (DUF6176)
MASLASAFPILPGKTAAWKQFAQELIGARRQEFEASRRRLGTTTERAYLQSTPQGDMAIVYIEADDIARVFQGLGSSQDSFDVWFREQVQAIHGLDLSKPPAGPLPEIAVDWQAR